MTAYEILIRHPRMRRFLSSYPMELPDSIYLDNAITEIERLLKTKKKITPRMIDSEVDSVITDAREQYGVNANPPFYAHNLYEKKTHGLTLKQMRRLYAMVSRGNQKAITYARNVLGIPFSESPSQVKAVVYHHVRDLAERRVRRNPRGYSNIEKSAFERGAYVGYSPKGVYKIRKMGRKGGWRAMGDFSMSFPPRVVTRMLYAKDLAEMSKRLQENPLTEDERYHLGRISRDPYLRRHFTGFRRKRKKTRKRVRRNPLSYYVGGLSSLGARGEERRRMRLGKMEYSALEFARKYPGWHGFNPKNPTGKVIKSLAKKGLVEISDISNQFKIR